MSSFPTDLATRPMHSMERARHRRCSSPDACTLMQPDECQSILQTLISKSEAMQRWPEEKNGNDACAATAARIGRLQAA